MLDISWSSKALGGRKGMIKVADGLSVWSAAFSKTHYQTPPASLSLPRKKCSHFQERDWPRLGHVFTSQSPFHTKWCPLGWVPTLGFGGRGRAHHKPGRSQRSSVYSVMPKWKFAQNILDQTWKKWGTAFKKRWPLSMVALKKGRQFMR